MYVVCVCFCLSVFLSGRCLYMCVLVYVRVRLYMQAVLIAKEEELVQVSSITQVATLSGRCLYLDVCCCC